MRIQLRGNWYTLDALTPAVDEGLGVSESHAVRFIQAWLDGQQEYTFQTSGSTGAPKSITFHRRQLEASAYLSLRALHLNEGHRALVCLDTRFVAGALMLVRALIGKMDLIIREPSANPLVGLHDPVDFMAVVPLQLSTLLKESRPELERTSVVLVGGAPTPEELLEDLPSLRPALYATYGMTETLTHIALRRLNGPSRQGHFYPLPGIQVKLDDRGCLVIHALHLGIPPVITNDLARLETDGGFTITGRYDEVINSGGVKVQPRRVEAAAEQALSALGIRCRYFAIGVPDERLHQAVCLVLEGSPLPTTVEDTLKENLSRLLGKYEVPREIYYSAHFTETATQKIDRQASLAAARK